MLRLAAIFLAIPAAGLSGHALAQEAATPSSAAPSSSATAPADPAALEFFEKEVRPILVARCYECHSGTSKRLEGGLRLDSLAAATKGGDTGPAVVPGNTKESLLVDAINYIDFERCRADATFIHPGSDEDGFSWTDMRAPGWEYLRPVIGTID